MPIRHGVAAIAAVFMGSTAIDRVYFGETLVFDASPDGPGESPHAYWRVFVAHTNEASWCLIREIEMASSAGGADLCSGGSPIASHATSGTEGMDKAFDGDTATFWQAATGANVWIGYHFAAPVGITEVRLNLWGGSYPNRGPRAGWIQWSDDGTTWTTAWTFMRATNFGTNGWMTLSKPTGSGPARYWGVGITGYAAKTTDVPSILEMQLREAINGADATGSGTAYSSSNLGGSYVAGKAFDNSWTTLFAGNWSNRDLTGVWYDFGSGVTKDIQQVVLVSRETPYHIQAPTTFDLLRSDDGLNFSTVESFSNTTAWTQYEERYFTRAGATRPAYTDMGDTGGLLPHRYWRVRTLCEAYGTNYLGLTEIRLFETSGGTNIAPLVTPTATPGPVAGSGAAVIDGDTTGFGGLSWTDGADRILTWDFGAGNEKTVIEYMIFPHSPYTDRTPRITALEYSDDATTWHVSLIGYNDSWTVGTGVTFTRPATVPAVARAHGLFFRRLTSAAPVAVGELEFRATHGGSDLTSPGGTFAVGSYYSSGTLGSYAFDNLSNTLWSALYSADDIILYDYGAGNDHDVVEVLMRSRHDGYQTTSPSAGGLVLKSTNGKSFVPAWSFPTATWLGSSQVHIFERT